MVMKSDKIFLLALLSLFQGMSLMSFFDITNKNQKMDISCYDNVVVNATVATGGNLVIATGSCNIQAAQGMGKAGDVVELKNIPSPINLGSITNILQSNNITTPANGQKILVTFRPTTGSIRGANVEFVIEHIAPSQLDAEIRARGLESAAEILKQNNPGQPISMFVYYRSLPGITTGWLDLGQTLTTANTLLPYFNITVDSDAKLMISADTSRSMELFDLSQIHMNRQKPGATSSQNAAQVFKNLIEFKEKSQGL
jgi:hypothetical protein